jgi:hypothetical protein
VGLYTFVNGRGGALWQGFRVSAIRSSLLRVAPVVCGAIALLGAAAACVDAAMNSEHPSTDDGDASTEAGCGPLGCQPDLVDASIGVRASTLLGGCAGGPEASCHGGGGQVGLHLPDSPPNLVNVPSTEVPTVMRVLPGDPEHSYLYWKITGDSRIDGGRMPLLAPPLASGDIEVLRSWIEAGAPRQ